eukprot:CAMPEP_0113939004 /NCGR_PEP_ID=MMETSP1339-20121228/5398_1 /TAXON_ID=94617 /ORGANISM="Fibrocapsa japonica" /LENGTH=257 /DNA_ID=CAMNT_0000942369 /DNA_START=118 /DNA_END=891 /DNA_ORIENTATION=+ /assembly_acc=CAM_ASM_000762
MADMANKIEDASMDAMSINRESALPDLRKPNVHNVYPVSKTVANAFVALWAAFKSVDSSETGTPEACAPQLKAFILAASRLLHQVGESLGDCKTNEKVDLAQTQVYSMLEQVVVDRVYDEVHQVWERHLPLRGRVIPLREDGEWNSLPTLLAFVDYVAQKTNPSLVGTPAKEYLSTEDVAIADLVMNGARSRRTIAEVMEHKLQVYPPPEYLPGQNDLEDSQELQIQAYQHVLSLQYRELFHSLVYYTACDEFEKQA